MSKLGKIRNKMSFVMLLVILIFVPINSFTAGSLLQETNQLSVQLLKSITPTLLGHYDTDGTALRVYVSGDVAYVADWGNGLVCVNVSDPTDPDVIGHYDTDDWAIGVYVSGDVAYMAN